MREAINIPITKGMLADLHDGIEVGWEVGGQKIALQPAFLTEEETADAPDDEKKPEGGEEDAAPEGTPTVDSETGAPVPTAGVVAGPDGDPIAEVSGDGTGKALAEVSGETLAVTEDAVVEKNPDKPAE